MAIEYGLGTMPELSSQKKFNGDAINLVMLLAIEGLSVNYGGLAALRGVSVSVEQGQFVAIVGPNGAGKTTLFKAISGVVPAGAGTITYEGRDLLSIRAHERMHLGIAHVPEGRQVF